MTDNGWLPLQNYSTKYNVSLSTLRRRIKAESIPFKLESGKYYILDDLGIPSQEEKIAIVKSQHPAQESTSSHTMAETSALASSSFVEASVLTSANRLVEEIKAAYAKILQEKEEKIGLLKEQVVDLKMLVKILEDSVARNHATAAVQSGSADVDAEETTAAKEPSAASEEFFFNDYQSRDI